LEEDKLFSSAEEFSTKSQKIENFDFDRNFKMEIWSQRRST